MRLSVVLKHTNSDYGPAKDCCSRLKSAIKALFMKSTKLTACMFDK